jgi:hypothetical protein
LNPFLQLAAEKKDSKNGAARKFFGLSYFDPTLGVHKNKQKRWNKNSMYLASRRLYICLCMYVEHGCPSVYPLPNMSLSLYNGIKKNLNSFGFGFGLGFGFGFIS